MAHCPPGLISEVPFVVGVVGDIFVLELDMDFLLTWVTVVDFCTSLAVCTSPVAAWLGSSIRVLCRLQAVQHVGQRHCQTRQFSNVAFSVALHYEQIVCKLFEL